MKKVAKTINYYKTSKIFGVKVDFVSIQKAITEIEKWVKSNKKHQITTPNPEQIILAQKDYRFKKILNNSSLAVADGVGLVWAVRVLKLQNSKTPKLQASSKYQIQNSKKWRLRFFKRAPSGFKLQRLAGVDLMVEMCKLAAARSWRVFLLGGKNDAAKKAAKSISHSTIQPFSNRFKIDYFEGSKNIKNESDQEKKEAIKRINNFKPHFLFVAYGAPEQEKWIYGNLDKLNVKVAMGVGGAFDYLAGKTKRAPLFVRKLGLEWFWRLLHQPWRIKRQLALGKFTFLIIVKLLNCKIAKLKK